MAAMAESHRIAVVEEILSKNRDGEPDSLTFAEWLALVGAIDDWIVANAQEFNQALPLPARSELTAAQKARYFMFVVRRRFLVEA
jgi:hypothetical protein